MGVWRNGPGDDDLYVPGWYLKYWASRTRASNYLDRLGGESKHWKWKSWWAVQALHWRVAFGDALTLIVFPGSRNHRRHSPLLDGLFIGCLLGLALT
jgi:hypothetical protein